MKKINKNYWSLLTFIFLLSFPLLSYAQTTIQIQENENGFCNVDGNVDNTYPGSHTGDGYARTSGDIGDGIDWAVNAGSTSSYTLRWRYASDSSTSKARVLVNGIEQVSSVQFNYSPVTWKTVSVTVNLSAGNNRIRLEGLQGGGSFSRRLHSIDWMEVTGDNPTPGNCNGDISLKIQENAGGICNVDGTIDADNTGFTGAGFANTDDANGIGIDWAVDASSAGSYTLQWRYANESSSNRRARVIVNGSQQISNVDFASTGAWTSWSTSASVTINLSAGNNRIRLEALQEEGLANIDWIEVIGNNPTVGTCGNIGSTSIQIQENENGFCFIDGAIDDNVAGFTGAGFANTYDNIDAGIEWEVITSSSSSYTLRWRYNKNNNFNFNSARIFVNGSPQIPIVDLPPTSSISSWVTSESATVFLPAGTNTIRLETIDLSGLPNIDWMEVTGDNPTTGDCNLSIGTTLQIQESTSAFCDGPIVNLISNNILNGYTGASYTSRGSTAVEWAVNAGSSSRYIITWRHAFSISGSYSTKVIVNGIEQIPLTIFRPTGSNWRTTVSVTVNLTTGNNIIRLEPAQTGIVDIAGCLPFIDWIEVRGDNPTTGNCNNNGDGTALQIQENESSNCTVQGSIDNNNSGFTGAGFANTDNVIGAGMNWGVNTGSAGTYTLQWRYANESSTNRRARILVNGSEQVSTVDFGSTGAWTSWITSSAVTVNLSAGNNTICLQAIQVEGLANIDWISISGDNPTLGTCNGNCDDGSGGGSNPFLTGNTGNENCPSPWSDTDNDGICDAADFCQGADDNLDSDNDGIPDGCDDDFSGGGGSDPFLTGNTGNENCPSPWSDTDNDGICDAADICQGGDDNFDADSDGIPDACDDTSGGGSGPYLTGNTGSETCSVWIDSDNDGVCDDADVCEGADDYADADADGIPDACDDDSSGGTGGSDPYLTGNSGFETCPSPWLDTDGDGICDAADICQGADDYADEDGDGIPDACDNDNTSSPFLTGNTGNENCPSPWADADFDGICDAADICQGADDNLDTDNDGIPDGCDTSTEARIAQPERIVADKMPGRKVNLTWAANEVHAPTLYTVQHSTDGQHYTDLFTASPRDNAKIEVYYDQHMNPSIGNNFYRLKIDYLEKNSEYYEDEPIYFIPTDIKAFPNPTKDILYVNLSEIMNTSVSIKLFTIQGVELDTIEIDANHAEVIQLDMRPYHNGLYTLIIKPNPDSYRGRIISQKVVLTNTF